MEEEDTLSLSRRMKIPFLPPTHAEHTPFITSNGVRANACSHRHIKALFHVQLSRHFVFTTASIDIYKQTNTQSRMNRHSFTHAYYAQDPASSRRYSQPPVLTSATASHTKVLLYHPSYFSCSMLALSLSVPDPKGRARE